MSALPIKVKIGQIYSRRKRRHGIGSLEVEVVGKKKDKYLTRILTDKPGVYAGSHTLSRLTIFKEYELVS